MLRRAPRTACAQPPAWTAQCNAVQVFSLSKYHLVTWGNLHPDPGSNFWIHNPGKQLPPQHGPAGCSAHPLPGRALSTLNSHPVSLLHSPTMTLSPPLQDPCLLGRTRDRNTTKCHSCLQGESPFLIISVLPVCIFPVRCFHAVCNHRGGCTDGEQRY